MERIDNEVWLRLADGRLISMNQHAAPTHIAENGAELIPPERVVRANDAGAFALLDEDDPRVAEGKAAAEKAAKEKADAEAAAAADGEVEDTVAPVAPVESAAVEPTERAVTGKPSARKPA
jgi:hypothetical protein